MFYCIYSNLIKVDLQMSTSPQYLSCVSIDVAFLVYSSKANDEIEAVGKRGLGVGEVKSWPAAGREDTSRSFAPFLVIVGYVL